jgi:hypothetical protein
VSVGVSAKAVEQALNYPLGCLTGQAELRNQLNLTHAVSMGAKPELLLMHLGYALGKGLNPSPEVADLERSAPGVCSGQLVS